MATKIFHLTWRSPRSLAVVWSSHNATLKVDESCMDTWNKDNWGQVRVDGAEGAGTNWSCGEQQKEAQCENEHALRRKQPNSTDPQINDKSHWSNKSDVWNDPNHNYCLLLWDFPVFSSTDADAPLHGLCSGPAHRLAAWIRTSDETCALVWIKSYF